MYHHLTHAERNRSEILNASAWIVNWLCVVMLFIGLVMVNKKLADIDNHETGGLAELKRECVQ